MQKQISKFLLSSLIISTFFLSGCNFFNGSYESIKNKDQAEDVNFAEGEQILKEHIKELSKEKSEIRVDSENKEEEKIKEEENLINLNNKPKNMDNTTELSIDKNKDYTVVLHTEAGDITIALTADKTPITVNNFITLAKSKFYDGTIFHRVINGFMIQGGDPDGNGTGGPGYKFDDEKFDGEYSRGTIAMANSGPNTNGSQFFIMHKDYPLPLNYVIFGKTVDGFEIIDKIADSEVIKSQTGEGSQPVTPIKITSIDILEK